MRVVRSCGSDIQTSCSGTVPEADYVWRIILMFGQIPAAIMYYWRMKMPETAHCIFLVAKNACQASSDMAKVLQVEIEAAQAKVEALTTA
ncbi:putative inorganic phosphate transporter 1-12 [Acorus calamus]|uniref:Inorganic phosphate transporter 1-12 n=1 Tax=Acorus calamus TaxID=4465 RepID=A0AAV9E6R1_ACOCL|nr:putative inorganic phosphate transporter 1-12 [Acorus calamus]